MDPYVLDFRDVSRDQVALVGGKGAHLGELSRIEGIHVPRGFCVTTNAFRRVAADAATRQAVEALAMPDEVAAAIKQSLARLGRETPFAVRSSATAEDSPTASFAGQHDTYLNVVGTASVLEHVIKCWASLFSERAVTYRLRNNIDHRQVSMAVVVQQMVPAESAGILFTADPISGNRKVAAIEAIVGLGEALVSGVTNADAYKVRDGKIVEQTIRQRDPVLTEPQIVRLVELGRRIEAHFGSPQDIEWCLADDEFQFVQSRPITTLFPVPETSDGENHVYVSTGHQQMMTDAMKPLGISFWQMAAPRPFAVAGGRLFVDVTQILANPASRAGFFGMLGKSDPLIGDAVQTILDRGDFLPSLPNDAPAWVPPGATPAGTPPLETDASIVHELIARSESSITALKSEIRNKTGPALLDFIAADLQEGKKFLFDPLGTRTLMAGIEATWWLNEKLQEWLGEKNAADTLSLSVPNNVTSEMGLALLDVADVIRPHRDVVAFLEQAGNDDFLKELPALEGGRETQAAIQAWLDRYGMRGAGEIDITRPRWSEHPGMLLPLLLGHIRNFGPGEAERRFGRGRQGAWQKEQDVLRRLRQLPDGEEKAQETKRMIDRVRTFIGYREYPKYGKIAREFVYRQALLEEAERLVRAHILREKEDISYLTFDELRDVVREQRVDDQLVRERKEAFRRYQKLTPPRVLTSEGEALNGSYRRDDLPKGALTGLAVSSGTVEGRARVVHDMSSAVLEPGDILVTAYTDPSWTPLFIAIRGLVTEVGGLMTHGAVIAREYGLPAVVGVPDATRLIKDGQRIRVHGTDGYVELLG